MSSDLSRIGFDPHLDDLGVLVQQGRPTTDRDANDFVLQATRRIQAGMLDTVGPAAVPAATTADAFLVTQAGATLEIARGRLYVDGLLAENHGAPKNATWSWDPQLAELFGDDPIGYGMQPYYPNAPTLPATNGPHLVYLDVWQREVTHHMRDTPTGSPAGIDTRLVDAAVGVDTTTRLQTVWQVKVLADVGNASCQTPIEDFPNWLPLNAHSAGRLTVDTVDVPGTEDPCQVPPDAGYKGRENQLYRVEVHDPGAIGQATFKWSRDNASVETRVSAIDASRTVLTVASIGRDEWLRFNKGDWVEVTDDWRELHNLPGEMRRIALADGVDEVARTLTLETALPLNAFPVTGQLLTFPERHTRVKRWDQAGEIRNAAGNVIVDLSAAGSTGTIAIPAAGTQVLLEHDIVVSFGLEPQAGVFRTGDWWVFAARSADHTVEKLLDAPPRGIHHHYTKLGIWDPVSGGVQDCRVPWPGECGGCCTVNVAPGESIQAALDSLPPEGGCVCLKTGVHAINETIRLERSRLVLRGESPGAIVRGPVVTMLRIGSATGALSDIEVTDIRFESSGTTDDDATAVVETRGCERLRVHQCAIVGTAPAAGARVAAFFGEVDAVRFASNRIEGVVVGVNVMGYTGAVEIDGNHLEGRPLAATGNGLDGGLLGVVVMGALDGACGVRDNFITSFATGVRIAERADRTIVRGNHIVRAPVETADAFPAGTDELRDYLARRIYAIDVRATSCLVEGNTIDLTAAAWGGIFGAGPGLQAVDNLLDASEIKGGVAKPVPAGIYCVTDVKFGQARACEIAGNRLLGAQAGIVLSRLTHPTARDNRLEGAFWYGVLADDCIAARIAGNRIFGAIIGLGLVSGERNRVQGNQVSESGFGILALQDRDLEIASTQVVGCSEAGAMVFAYGHTALLGCRFAGCGFGNTSAGILVMDSLLVQGAMLRIEDCEVIDTGISPDLKTVATERCSGISALAQACELVGNHVGYSGMEPALPPAAEHRALFLLGPALVAVGTGKLGVLSSALVTGNQFRGPGAKALVEFQSIPVAPNTTLEFERVTFSNNTCDHWAKPDDSAVTVRIRAAKAIAMGNQVKSPASTNSISVGSAIGSLVGNVVTGAILGGAGIKPAPIANFNVINTP